MNVIGICGSVSFKQELAELNVDQFVFLLRGPHIIPILHHKYNTAEPLIVDLFILKYLLILTKLTP